LRASALLFVAAIIGAEVIALAVGPVAGAACDAVVLVAILNAYAAAPDRPESRLFPALALAPLLRLLSLTIPNRHIADIWWYAMVGAPLLLAVFPAGRVVPVSWPGLRIRRMDVRSQMPIALIGVPLGIAAYEILKPDAVISPLGAASAVGGSVILIVFAALPEELVFRGLIQGAAREVFGPLGLLIVSVLSAGLYIGSESVAYVAFMGAVALALSFEVDRTGLIWGAIVARSLIDIGLLLAWPAVLG
jgi:membrane protease YdiL (CAAX protease family)